VKQVVAILLTLYALSMLSYGSLEMAHDLLHWMAAHTHSALHNHEHDHYHTFHDHEHHHLSENESPENTEFPSLIHFFLYYQQRQSFSFIISCAGILRTTNAFSILQVDRNPSTPPPQIV
jgi:ABC-type Zn2+ transport system substrate-binding protein/surface adhesin